MKNDAFNNGLKVRKAVLGENYVSNSLEDPDDFGLPLQELVTEYCWGRVWTRPGLSRKIRSLINISMLTALNRPHEVRMHVIGAINNGCSKQEILEVLLQACIYCGVPAAMDSMRVAKETFAELGI
jgi:4-carboxymuconolactone decarboxylase